MWFLAPLSRIAATIAGAIGLSALLVADEPKDGLAKKMFPIYVKEAEAYSFAVESAPKKELELKKEPVFEWANPARHDQQGVVFLWLRDGRPAALACIFTHPHEKFPGRQINHELHALDPEKLVVKRDAYHKWEPQKGLVRKELPDAPAPAATPAARQLQIRKLAEGFNGHEIDYGRQKWEFRLLPTPLYRYPTAKTGVLDGALFTLVSNAGTDPEVLLIIEAREVDGKLRWEYACGRFSDFELHLNWKDKEVFTSISSETNGFYNDPLHLYRLYPEKVVTLEGKVVARIKDGGLVPVEDK
jgi:hypothetical protein